MEFLLFVDRALDERFIPGGCRQVVVGKRFVTESQSMSGLASKLYSQYWMNVLVPRACARERVRLFHATNFSVPFRKTCPVVVTIHDLIYARAPGAFQRSYERYLSVLTPRAARAADHVVAVSSATRTDLVQLCRVPEHRVSVVWHGVSAEYRVIEDAGLLNRVRAQLSLPERFILHVGAVERRKKLDTLVEAAAPLLRQGLVDRVVLAGEAGHGAEDVWRRARELGVSDRVQHLGYVPQDALPGLYSLARVLTLASVYEGFGMPVLEAMACGTPVVVSDVSALPEVAGDAALKVRPGDVDGLRNALRWLLTDESRRKEMRRLGLARARDFTWRRSAEGHAAVFRKVLERATAGASA